MKCDGAVELHVTSYMCLDVDLPWSLKVKSDCAVELSVYDFYYSVLLVSILLVQQTYAHPDVSFTKYGPPQIGMTLHITFQVTHGQM